MEYIVVDHPCLKVLFTMSFSGIILLKFNKLIDKFISLSNSFQIQKYGKMFKYELY